MEKRGRIDKFSKDLLLSAEYVIIHRWAYPNDTFFSIGVETHGYPQLLTSGQGTLFFSSEKEAVNYIKRYRSSDLRNPDNSFRIIIRNVVGLGMTPEENECQYGIKLI